MTEELQNVYEKLLYFFEQRKFADLRMIILDMQPIDIARFIEDNIDKEQQTLFFRLLPKELASDVFVEFYTDTQEDLIKEFTDKELKAVIDDMFLDDTVDIIEEMPANVVKRILKNTTVEDRRKINELLAYPEDSAGSLMTPEFVTLSTSMTVEQAFNKIRRTGLKKETVYTCYITNNKKILLGVITVKDLLMADNDEKIEDIMDTNFIYAETHEDKEEVALKFSTYDFIAMPVVDKEGCIVGIVTVDDAVDALQEEVTEDIHKMSGMLPTEENYLHQSVFNVWKVRIPWLLILLISATFTGLILNIYEARLNAISTVLFACIPMLMGTGGNAGGQASATIIRSLALEEIEFKDIFKVIWKELRASILLGITLAVACFLKLLLIDNLLFGYSDYTNELCLVVSLTLFVTVIISKLVGACLPLFAKLCHLDPAVMASPFITTMVDIISLLVFCTISVAML